MKLLLSWKAFELDPAKGVDDKGSIVIRYTFGALVGLFSVKGGFCVIPYSYFSTFNTLNNNYIDSDFDAGNVTYHTDLESAIAEYEKCIATSTSELFGNVVRPVVVTDKDREHINNVLSGNDDTCKDNSNSFLLGTYEYADTIHFILYIDEDTVLYDVHKFSETNGIVTVDDNFMSCVLDFEDIPTAVDAANETLEEAFDLDYDDCFDEDEVLAKAREFGLVE